MVSPKQPRPIWPQAISNKDLDKIFSEYESQGQVDLFWREYFNKIVDSSGALFKREYFERWSVKQWNAYVRENDVRGFGLVDPAYSVAKKADYTAFGIVYTDAQNKMYVREILQGRWKMPQLIGIWLKLQQMFNVKWGIQAIDWEKSLKVPLQDAMRQTNSFFRVEVLPTYSHDRGLYSKTARIERLSPRYAAGNIVHIEGSQIGVLESELLSFPHGRNDDCADMLAMSLDLIYPAQKRVKKRGPKWLDESHGLYSKISGY